MKVDLGEKSSGATFHSSGENERETDVRYSILSVNSRPEPDVAQPNACLTFQFSLPRRYSRPHCHRERQSRCLLPLAISTHSMRVRPRLGFLLYVFLALFFHPLDFRRANEDAPELLEDRKTSRCTRVDF